jgi:hypothetical protein
MELREESEEEIQVCMLFAYFYIIVFGRVKKNNIANKLKASQAFCKELN